MPPWVLLGRRMSTPADSTIVNRPENDRSAPATYAVAIAALAAAVLIRYLLDPWMGNTLPLVTLFGAVATAVWTGGVRPAVAVVILGYLACSYLFIEPRGRIEFTDPGTLIGVLAYVFTCALIILFGEAAHRAQRRVGRDQSDQLLTARLLASIIESSDDAIISKSLNGIIQSWNAAAQRLFGYTADQAIGRHISLIIPPERIAEEDHIVSQLKAGKRIDHFETERLRSDGGRILVSLTISPIRDDAGTVIGASKIARDVTRQREAEHRERQLLAEATAANAKFHAFFEQGALFAGIMDVNGTLLEANRVSWEACGFTREQIIGRPFWEGPWWSPSPPLVEQIRAASGEAAAGQTFRAEMPYFVADGSERIADVTIQPIRDESGRVLFLAPTGLDITDRRRAEANLRRLAADLSDADRRKNEFLAMLAHELRNPLAPISNATRALRLSDGEGGGLQAAAAMLERQVGQMARLVDDLLDMSRITRGKIELRKERVELAPIVHQAVEAVVAQYRSMNHELTVTLPPHPVHLEADPARLAQVIGNLLNNACKFTDRGGHVWLTVDQEGDQAVIRVRDTGIGIATDDRSRLFEMFAQVDTSLERSRDGLGIGLTLVSRIQKKHTVV